MKEFAGIFFVVVILIGFFLGVFLLTPSKGTPDVDHIGVDLIDYGSVTLPDGRTWPIENASFEYINLERLRTGIDVFCNFSTNYHEDKLEVLAILHYRHLPYKDRSKLHPWRITGITVVKHKETFSAKKSLP